MENKFEFSTIIRYGFTGGLTIIIYYVNVIVMNLLSREHIINPSFYNELENVTKLIGVILFAFILGFFLDSLKLYSLKWSTLVSKIPLFKIKSTYKSRKDKFMDELATTLNVSSSLGSAYFSILIQLSKKTPIDLELRQSQWHFMENTHKVLIITFVYDVFVLLNKVVSASIVNFEIKLIIAPFLILLIALRFKHIAHQERIKLDKLILLFASFNIDEIKKCIKTVCSDDTHNIIHDLQIKM